MNNIKHVIIELLYIYIFKLKNTAHIDEILQFLPLFKKTISVAYVKEIYSKDYCLGILVKTIQFLFFALSLIEFYMCTA